MLQKLQNSRNGLGLVFMAPATILLVLFLTYPLGLGVWLGFTDTKIGRGGEFIGLENYEFLWEDSVTRLALFNTIFFRPVAGRFVERKTAFQNLFPVCHFAALHRAHRFVGAGFLVVV